MKPTLKTVGKVSGQITLIGGALGVVAALYLHLHTDAEADQRAATHEAQQQKEHLAMEHDHEELAQALLETNKVIAANMTRAIMRDNKSDADRHRREVARLQRDLIAGNYANADERQVMLNQISDYNDLIQRLDPPEVVVE
jgi:hypothetical protein